MGRNSSHEVTVKEGKEKKKQHERAICIMEHTCQLVFSQEFVICTKFVPLPLCPPPPKPVSHNQQLCSFCHLFPAHFQSLLVQM